MNVSFLVVLLSSLLLFSLPVEAQSTGRIECARSDGYVYLYSSMTTLEVRATLQCGETVQLTGHYEVYYAVRTRKGEIGYVPVANIFVLKDGAGSSAPAAASARERTPYDERPSARDVAPSREMQFGLSKDTPIRVKLLKTLSSASAHTGDAVPLEVLEDVRVGDVLVVSRGGKATGSVAEVEAKKRFGHDGRVSFNINSVVLANNETVPVRCYFEVIGDHAASGSKLASGKDATISEGTEFTARVDGDIRLNRASFSNDKRPESPSGSRN